MDKPERRYLHHETLCYYDEIFIYLHMLLLWLLVTTSESYHVVHICYYKLNHQSANTNTPIKFTRYHLTDFVKADINII